MNNKFRFAKFVVSGDHVGMQMDMPVEAKEVGPVCTELLYRLLDIADNAYPEFKAQLG